MWPAFSTCSISKQRWRVPKRQPASSPRARRARSQPPAMPNRSISARWPRPPRASGNLAIPLVKALTANVAKADAAGRALCPLGRHQPGRDRYRRHADLARRHRRAAGRSRSRHRRVCQTGSTASHHRGGGAHLAAACLADAVRTQTGGICRGTCIARAGGCSDCAAKRWRCSSAAPPARWRRLATTDCGSRRRLAAGARTAAAGCAVAYPSRPHRGGGLGVGDPCRHLRQDRPRCLTDDADRRRRGVRAVGRRPRRLLDHAAQAQSGGGRDRAGRGHHGAQSGRDDLRTRRCRSTSAAPGRGTRNGRHCRRCCSSHPARSRRLSILPKGWKSMRARMRTNLDATGGLIMAEAVTMALAGKIGKSDAHHLVEAASRQAVAGKTSLRDVLAGDSEGQRASRRRNDCRIVRPVGLSGRLAGPDRPAARLAR